VKQVLLKFKIQYYYFPVGALFFSPAPLQPLAPSAFDEQQDFPAGFASDLAAPLPDSAAALPLSPSLHVFAASLEQQAFSPFFFFLSLSLSRDLTTIAVSELEKDAKFNAIAPPVKASKHAIAMIFFI
jgi:hypothetical protein